MNCKKILTALVGFAGAMLFATSTNAQVTTVLVGVGSSAQFPTAGIAAVSPDPVNSAFGNVCGTHLWTGKNGSNSAVVLGLDPRAGGNSEPGSIWVAWDSSQTTACAYLSVDSIVGLRLFLAQGASGNGTLQFTSGTAAGGLITGFADTDATVPAAIVTALNGAHFNFAATDVRPEDGQYAFFRTANATGGGGFGYNTSCTVGGPAPSNAVLSSFSNTNALASCFHITGTDPISGNPIPAFTTVPLGAAPVIIFYNTTSTLGTIPTNINSKVATKFFSGQLGSTTAVFGSAVTNDYISEVQREPISGTYNTFEFQLVHARDGDSGDTQELYPAGGSGATIPPTPAACFTGGSAFAACTNPMYIVSGGLTRYRAIGTGEMVKAVNLGTTVHVTHPNAVGYAFYSLGSFWPTTSALNVKYLQLQGVDPLYTNYDNSGVFGTCSGSINAGPSTFKCTKTLPNFAHIVDGNYRVWSSYRWVIPASGSVPQITTLLEASQDQAAYALNNPAQGGITSANTNITSIADFVPTYYYPSGTKTAYFGYLRSHYPLSGYSADNGDVSAYCASDQTSGGVGQAACGAEEGGDMAGVAFPIYVDQSYYNTTGGAELLTQIE